MVVEAKGASISFGNQMRFVLCVHLLFATFLPQVAEVVVVGGK